MPGVELSSAQGIAVAASKGARPKSKTSTRNARMGGPAGAAESRKSHFTHFDAAGQAQMVDVGAKPPTRRVAIAGGRIVMQATTLALIQSGNAKKGDVLGVARIAAIQAAKRTSELIPLCHPIALTRVGVEFVTDAKARAIAIEVSAETFGPTGVEMEALTAAAVGLLTIYDMCKAVDRGMRVEGVHLIEKSGGRSGRYRAST